MSCFDIADRSDISSINALIEDRTSTYHDYPLKVVINNLVKTESNLIHLFDVNDTTFTNIYDHKDDFPDRNLFVLESLTRESIIRHLIKNPVDNIIVRSNDSDRMILSFILGVNKSSLLNIEEGTQFIVIMDNTFVLEENYDNVILLFENDKFTFDIKSEVKSLRLLYCFNVLEFTNVKYGTIERKNFYHHSNYYINYFPHIRDDIDEIYYKLSYSEYIFNINVNCHILKAKCCSLSLGINQPNYISVVNANFMYEHNLTSSFYFNGNNGMVDINMNKLFENMKSDNFIISVDEIVNSNFDITYLKNFKGIMKFRICYGNISTVIYNRVKITIYEELLEILRGTSIEIAICNMKSYKFLSNKIIADNNINELIIDERFVENNLILHRECIKSLVIMKKSLSINISESEIESFVFETNKCKSLKLNHSIIGKIVYDDLNISIKNIDCTGTSVIYSNLNIYGTANIIINNRLLNKYFDVMHKEKYGIYHSGIIINNLINNENMYHILSSRVLLSINLCNVIIDIGMRDILDLRSIDNVTLKYVNIRGNILFHDKAQIKNVIMAN